MAGVPARFVALELRAGITAQTFEAVVEELDVTGVVERRETQRDQGGNRPTIRLPVVREGELARRLEDQNPPTKGALGTVDLDAEPDLAA